MHCPVQYLPKDSAAVGTSYHPRWYLRNGHLQTMLVPYTLRPESRFDVSAHQVPFGENSATCLYESHGRSDSKSDQAILLIHGLAGSHASPYLVRIADHLTALGHRVFRMDLPGCGPSMSLSDLPAHAGCSDIIRRVMMWSSQHLGIARWRVAGFSLGGNILLKMLAESRQDGWSTGVERAVVVAPPIDLARCCDSIESRRNWLYNRFFVRMLRSAAHQRASLWPRWQERFRLLHKPIRSIRDFDDQFTAPLIGFQNAAEYYDQCSSARLLDRIRVPTEVLVDRSDPIVPVAIYEDAPWSSSCQLTITKHGGHLGYLNHSRSEGLGCWMDHWVADHLLD
ncbi:MAG: YheT family hydrolase [Pirellulaceae bacterium]